MDRTYWVAPDLTRVPVNEPLIVSLVRYRLHKDRYRTAPETANLISSKLEDGQQAAIIDLDLPHTYVPSTTPGHAHLYLDKAIPRWRWVALMIGLRAGRVIDKGAFVWSLRRGANFVRLPEVEKDESKEARVTYGWLFPKRGRESE